MVNICVCCVFFVLNHQLNDEITLFVKTVVPAFRIFSYKNLNVYKTYSSKFFIREGGGGPRNHPTFSETDILLKLTYRKMNSEQTVSSKLCMEKVKIIEKFNVFVFFTSLAFCNLKYYIT